MRKPVKRSKPEVFVASSAAHVDLAYDLQAKIETVADVTVWDQGVFAPSKYILDQLITTLERFDFGIFVFAPEDVTEIKGKRLMTVRDNVIFELGLFIGKLGRERCFIVTPRDAADLRLPSDLAGLTTIHFNAEHVNPQAALGPAAHTIRRLIEELGPLRSIASGPSTREVILDIWQTVSRPAPSVGKEFPVRALPKQTLNKGSGKLGRIAPSTKKGRKKRD